VRRDSIGLLDNHAHHDIDGIEIARIERTGKKV